MRPENAFKLTYSEHISDSSLSYAERNRKLFCLAYGRIAKKFPDKAELVKTHLARLKYAWELYKSRHVKTPSEGFASHDPYYYEWLDELREEEERPIDGDFPLGNDREMELAKDYFSVYEMAYITCGLKKMVDPIRDGLTDDEIAVRRGIFCELDGDILGAANAYALDKSDRDVDMHLDTLKKRLRKEGDAFYEQAQTLMGAGRWSEVAPLLIKGAEYFSPDAAVDYALALIYGQFGISQDIEKAVFYLRRAARDGSERACFELVELFDNGSPEVDADEAYKMCQRAARLGNKRAEARLQSPFPTGPKT